MQGLGLGRLARAYGGRKRRGVRTNHHCDAATGIIRHALKSLEDLELVEKSKRWVGL